ncbi:hypothetical protein BBAD15_g5481 [Beauveria bassiana D1-5]|uniref:Uncharacterized protein n=1 Tax=Beauveria bassiana D1-5 TaxID=1245745 RepID=A0A0A2VS88_BEABA|nr:hypothetical protein BBAD15_g5481 [Beauveria bassiana D1-5]
MFGMLNIIRNWVESFRRDGDSIGDSESNSEGDKFSDYDDDDDDDNDQEPVGTHCDTGLALLRIIHGTTLGGPKVLKVAPCTISSHYVATILAKVVFEYYNAICETPRAASAECQPKVECTRSTTRPVDTNVFRDQRHGAG